MLSSPYGGVNPGDDPAGVAASLAPERVIAVALAFTVDFRLVNLAEERQRIRALREGVAG